MFFAPAASSSLSFVFFLTYSSHLSPTPIFFITLSLSSVTLIYSSSSTPSLPSLLLSFFLSPPHPPPSVNGYSELFFLTFFLVFRLYSLHKSLTLWEIVKNTLCKKYLISSYTEVQIYISLSQRDRL